MSDDTYTVALHGWRSWFDFPVSKSVIPYQAEVGDRLHAVVDLNAETSDELEFSDWEMG